MPLQSLTCASCGATISVPDDLDRITCAHCGTALTVERGAGYIASRLAEAVHTDLERVQLRQEATALELQLSNIETEGRALRRQRPATVLQQQQLAQLERRYDGLVTRLTAIQDQLGVPHTHQLIHPPVPPEVLARRAAEQETAARQTRIVLRVVGIVVMAFIVLSIIVAIVGH
ncbi:MAG: hypothetical protein ACTHMR_21545 [Thermomicrobiales bacterium]